MAKILIVDDISENRYLLAALFHGHGYDVVGTANGVEALEYAQATPPDLLITDILMPLMDGFDLCRRWKRDAQLRHIPVIIYTATYTDPKDEHLALSLGADRFLIKPQKPEVLLRVMQEVLEAAKNGHSAPAPTPEDETELLRQHNEALVRKLSKKVAELEREIIERDRLMATVQENAALLRIAGRVARLGGWNVELTDMRLRLSEEMSSILGVTSEKPPTLEEGLLRFFASGSRERVVEAFQRCAQEGTPCDVEAIMLTEGRKRLYVRLIGEAVRDASGTIKRVQGAFQDITDRKLAEEEQLRLQNELLHAKKVDSIGRLAGGVAHDFNNLLSVIMGCADFGIKATHDGDPLRTDFEEIRKAGVRAATLTRQLLAFTRRQILAPEVLNLNRLITGLASMLRRLVREDIEIEFDLAEAVGNVVADPGQIEQVLVNLTVNARDAMHAGGKLTIQTANVIVDTVHGDGNAEVKPGRYVTVSVTDTGTGMDAATKERIFEPFFTTKARSKGTGLGLSTVQGVIEQSGGTVLVDSEPGRGATFTVYLPMADAELAKVESRPAPSASAKNETVLIVEDEIAVRTVAERILRSAGYRVLVASNGGEALLICEKRGGNVDLLLSDIVLPHMGGLEVAQRLSQLCPKLKVLYMSGYPDVSDNGARFVGKPFSADELTREVRAALDA